MSSREAQPQPSSVPATIQFLLRSHEMTEAPGRRLGIPALTGLDRPLMIIPIRQWGPYFSHF